MIFSSAPFLYFFIIIAIIHWYVVPNLVGEKYRLRVLHSYLLIASYVFYMSWDWRFGSLMAFSTLVDYFAGLYMQRLEERDGQAHKIARLRKAALLVSLFTNLGILAYFKYSNFFIGSLVDLVNAFSSPTEQLKPESFFLDVVLPLGISFFTFQSMSYTIDVYRKVIPTERNFIRFALYVSFFPQLVAGPIVVAKDFLPQLKVLPKFDLERMRIAAYWFILGYTKKVLLADNVGHIVTDIFNKPEKWDMAAHWIGALGFWVQIYGDFSGYSDMAWGAAIFLGYRLPVNFHMPYLSTSVTEHWQRWHISLVMWIRDYLYIPLGGNRVGFWRHKFNIFFTMFLTGVWHGANWTFVVWGIIHGSIVAAESIAGGFFRQRKERKEAALQDNADATDAPARESGDKPWNPKTALVTICAFLATSIVGIYVAVMFRALNITNAWLMMGSMIGFEIPLDPKNPTPPLPPPPRFYKPVFMALAALYIGHLFGHFIFNKKFFWKPPVWVQVVLLPIIILLLIQIGANNEAAFIYFVF